MPVSISNILKEYVNGIKSIFGCDYEKETGYVQDLARGRLQQARDDLKSAQLNFSAGLLKAASGKIVWEFVWESVWENVKNGIPLVSI